MKLESILFLICLTILIFAMATPKDTNPLCPEIRRLKDNHMEAERWNNWIQESPKVLEECKDWL